MSGNDYAARWPVTDREKEVLTAFRKFTRRHGCPPTVRELANVLDLGWSPTYRLLIALEKKGKLVRRKGVSRAWRLAPNPDGTPV